MAWLLIPSCLLVERARCSTRFWIWFILDHRPRCWSPVWFHGDVTSIASGNDPPSVNIVDISIERKHQPSGLLIIIDTEHFCVFHDFCLMEGMSEAEIEKHFLSIKHEGSSFSKNAGHMIVRYSHVARGSRYTAQGEAPVLLQRY